MLVGGNEAECHRVIARTFQLAARKHAGGIAVDDQAEQQFGMVGRLARATIAAGHRPQIQPPNDLHYEPSQVALRQPLVHRGWQQKAGLAVNRAEVAHAFDVQGSQGLRCHLFDRTIPRRVKSDRLLGDLVALATRHLKKGDKIRLTGLGILQVRKRAAGWDATLRNGGAIKIKIAFRPAKELKEAV